MKNIFGWEVKKLGKVATFINGYPFKPVEWSDKGLPIIRIQNLNNESAKYNYFDGNLHDKYLICSGDILISWSASLGVYEWKNENAYLNQHIFKVVFDKIEINKYYFKYLIEMKLDEMIHSSHGSGMKHITKKDFDNIDVSLHPLPTQHQIVSELDALSEIISKKKQQLQELDKLAQATFYDMFGDPVTNEKGWEKDLIGNVFNVSAGGTPKTNINEYWDNGTISWIGSNMCKNNVLYSNDGKYITELGLSKSSAKIYKPNTILVALVGATIGKVSLLKFHTSTNQNIAGIDINSNLKFNAEFVFYMMMNLYHLFMEIGDDKFKMANLSFVRNLPIITPPISLQNDFATKIESIESQKSLITQSIADVQQLFDYTMDKYFN